MFDDTYPYVVPVSFGYQEGVFYFHSAPEGKKVELLKKNNRVCFELEADVAPLSADKPCKWTMQYSSVIGFGKVLVLEGHEQKKEGLEVICQHYAGTDVDVTEGLDRLAVFKIEVDSLAGKASPGKKSATAGNSAPT